MIESVNLQNFKAHRDTRVPLARLTVLVGQNAVGKTSVLQAMDLLGRCLRVPAEKLFTGRYAPTAVARQGASEPLQIELEGAFPTARARVGLDTNGLASTARIDGEALLPAALDLTLDVTPLGATKRVQLGLQRKQVEALRDHVDSLLLRLDEARLAEPSYIEEERPRMAGDGYGLATVLSELKRSDTARFQAFEEAVRAVVPAFRAFGFKRAIVQRDVPRVMTVDGQRVMVNETSRVVADELLLSFRDASAIPASGASEGTLLAVGLLAALHAEPRPRALLVDDLDRALHPFAQRALVEALRRALDLAPDVQVVATTHSPYLVDALAASEVVVLGRAKDDSVRALRLSEHPARRHLEALTTGEFWSAEGEDWVAST